MNRIEFLNEIENKISSFHPKLSENNNDENFNDSLFYSHDMESNTFIKIMTYEELNIFDGIIKFSISFANISKKYSEEYIKKQITGLFHSLLKDSANISNIKDFYTSLLDNPSDKWFIVSQIEKIRLLDISPYQLIDCTIKSFEKSDLPPDVDIEDEIDPFILNCIGNPCIYTIVEAGELEKAIILANENFTTSFNLLRLFFPSIKPAIKGTFLSGTQELSYHNISKKLYGKSKSITHNFHNETLLTNEIYSYLLENGIGDLSNESSISKVIKECLLWFGIGLDEKIQSAKLLNFVTILESALKRKGERDELKQRVADRCAMILGNDFDTRKDIAKEISKIYAQRSKVVHTGTIIDDQNIADLSGSYARIVLLELIKKNKQFNGNFDKFITEIDDLKYK